MPNKIIALYPSDRHAVIADAILDEDHRPIVSTEIVCDGKRWAVKTERYVADGETEEIVCEFRPAP